MNAFYKVTAACPTKLRPMPVLSDLVILVSFSEQPDDVVPHRLKEQVGLQPVLLIARSHLKMCAILIAREIGCRLLMLI
jgi:hypothetical protein